MPADKEQQEKYDVEDNPVYAICGKSQHHKKRSSVAHEYETVVPTSRHLLLINSTDLCVCLFALAQEWMLFTKLPHLQVGSGSGLSAW